MGLFSKSSSKSTAKVDTANIDASGNDGFVLANNRSRNVATQDNQGLVLANAKRNKIKLTDHGAIEGALSFASDTFEDVLDFGGEAIESVNVNTRETLRSNENQLSAIEKLAESVSVGDREVSAGITKMMLIMGGLLLAFIVFMVIR